MNQHDVDRIESALWVLLQYKYDDKFVEVLKDSCNEYGESTDEIFDILEDLQTHFH